MKKIVFLFFIISKIFLSKLKTSKISFFSSSVFLFHNSLILIISTLSFISSGMGASPVIYIFFTNLEVGLPSKNIFSNFTNFFNLEKNKLFLSFILYVAFPSSSI